MNNDVLKAIRTRRSIRNFQDRPLDKAVIETLLEAGRLAPTAMGRQACHYIVVTDREMIARLSKICVDLVTFVMKNHWWTRLFLPIARDKEFRQAVLSRRGGLDDPVYYGAPCLIMTAAPRSSHENGRPDCLLACQNMMIAACSFGVESIFVGYGASFARRLEGRRLVDFPKDYDLHGVVCFGYPQSQPDSFPERKDNILNWIGPR